MRPTSGISLAEVRWDFEFSSDRLAFYPPSVNNSRRVSPSPTRISTASVSSYGRGSNAGSTDLFDYGLPNLRARTSSGDMPSIPMSMSV